MKIIITINLYKEFTEFTEQTAMQGLYVWTMYKDPITELLDTLHQLGNINYLGREYQEALNEITNNDGVKKLKEVMKAPVSWFTKTEEWMKE